MPVFDASGNIIQLDQDLTAGNAEGASTARNSCQVLYNSGGPPDVNGVPSQQMFDRMRSLQGKNFTTVAITATTTGDMSLFCSAGALKGLMAGQSVRLTGGAPEEYVYVAPSYLPSATATSIPLQKPVVQAGNTAAAFDTFITTGSLLQQMIPPGMAPFVAAAVDAFALTQLRLLQTASTDTLQSNNNLAVASVGYNGSTSERMRSPNVYKAFNAQAVTASSANTPTSIWTPTSGKKFRLMGYWFSTTAAAGLVFHDLASVGGTGLLPLPSPIAAAAGIVQSPGIGNGFLSAAANNQLWVDATVATTLTGFVWGTQE